MAKLSESQIQQTCCEFLALDGWRRIRTDMRQLRGMGVQEPGMADDLFIRYEHIPQIAGCHCQAQVLWIEWKAKKGRHGTNQADWQRQERARGALVWVAQQDFPASIEGFREHYRNSGLMRRKLLTAALRRQNREVAIG